MCLVGWLDTKIEVDQRILELGQFSLCWEVSTFIGREIFGFEVLCHLPSWIAISAVEVPFFFFFLQ
uniref:Gpatc8 protein n=1 Tax=Mus musculus TaxID=10090 RepID=Q8VE29_MOUSE|nr:Gpatc8 protein [Mus musculus]